MMECYSFEKIAKNYGKKQVLWGVSGKFLPGSTVGLLGLNGAGKTTLLNILGNCDRDFSGSISLRGNAVAYMRSRQPFPEFWQVREVFAFYRRFYRFDNFLADQMLREAKNSVSSLGFKCAIMVIAMAPLLVVYPFIQRYFVKGIMVGAVKG